MGINKEPPDKYRCLKLPIRNILIKDANKQEEVKHNMDILQNAVYRTNAITTKGCINRDKNGCKNIQKVFKSYMETGERPERYRREYKFQ